MAIAQNFPKIRPSLNLSFALTKALDPRITYARASAATYYGTETAKAEENLFRFSQEFDNAGWFKTNITVTANTEIAPDGTTTAETLTATAVAGAHATAQAVSKTTGLVYTVSAFVKAGTHNFVQLLFATSTHDTLSFANFDVSLGVLGTVGSSATATITSVGGGWYRCTCTATATGTALGFPNIILVPSASATRNESWTAAGTETVFLWGAQLEVRSMATNYTPTTNQPITNFVPVLESAAAGEARFDHNPVTGESLGLLIEESRTNLLLRSEEFDNAGWSKANATVTANTIVAPSGEVTGDLLTCTATGGFNGRASQNISNQGVGATRAFSFYAKRSNNDWIMATVSMTNNKARRCWWDLANGVIGGTAGATAGGETLVSHTITPVGNDWYRLVMVVNPNAEEISGIQFLQSANDNLNVNATEGQAFFIWGAQLEAGAFPTSYVKTTTAQVTRAADAASMTGANFSSWYSGGAGTVYSESAVYAANIKTQCVWELGGGVTSTSLRSPQGTVNRLRATVGGTFSGGSTGAVISNNTFIKATVAWQGLGGRLQSGATGEDVTGAANLDATQLIVGGLGAAGSTALNGHIKKLAFYPAKIANDQLQALTG